MEVEKFIIIRYPRKLSFDKYGKQEEPQVAIRKIFDHPAEAEKKQADLEKRYGALYSYEVALVTMSNGR